MCGPASVPAPSSRLLKNCRIATRHEGASPLCRRARMQACPRLPGTRNSSASPGPFPGDQSQTRSRRRLPVPAGRLLRRPTCPTRGATRPTGFFGLLGARCAAVHENESEQRYCFHFGLLESGRTGRARLLDAARVCEDNRGDQRILLIERGATALGHEDSKTGTTMSMFKQARRRQPPRPATAALRSRSR